jgi:hypothetical protein
VQLGGIQNSALNTASGVTRSSGFAYYDPRDTNQDGVVSPGEANAYSLAHPEWEALTRLRTAGTLQDQTMASNAFLDQYTLKGALNRAGKTTSGLFDGYA